MSTKEYLKQLQKMEVMIKQRQQEKDELCAMITSIGSFDYAKERVQTSPSGDAQYVKMMEKITELEKEINDLITEYAVKKDKIISQIHALKNHRYMVVLHKRYVEFKKIEEIADEMGYTYPYAVSLHGHAIKEFAKENVSIFSKK